MRPSRTLILFVTLLIPAACLGAAAQPYIQRSTPQRKGNMWVEQIHCSLPVSEGGRLAFRADGGSVAVQPGEAGQLRCLLQLAAFSRNPDEARNCLDQYLLKAIRIPRGGVLLNGQSFCRESFGSLSARFEIEVPLKFDLDIQTQEGNVDVTRLDGQLRAETTGGDIRTGDVRGPVSVSTGAGMVDLGNIGQGVQASTAGGNIQVGNVSGRAVLNTSGGEIVAGIVNGPVTAQTGAGDIVLQAASGPVEVETAGGQIHLGECGNTVRAETAAGNIQVAGARGGVNVQSAGGSINLLQAMSSVMAQTEAGHILAQIDASRKSFGPSQLATQVGDVDVFLPPDLPVTIHAAIANALGHRIISDFPVNVVKEDGGFMVGPVAGDAKLMGGGDLLDLRTTMGSILIRRLDPAAVAQMKAFQDEFWTRWRQNETAQTEALRRIQEMQSRLARQRVGLERQLQYLNSHLVEQLREQERSVSVRRIQEIQQQLERQVARDQAQRVQQFQELQERLERQTTELERRLEEMERHLAERAREQMQYVQDQEQ
jgi:hypothetical protein